jgi:hypothetical protein
MHVVMQDPTIDKTVYRLPGDEKYLDKDKFLWSDDLAPNPIETVLIRQK